MIHFAWIDGQGLPTGGGTLRYLPAGAVELPAPYTSFDLSRLHFQDGKWIERSDPPKDAPPPPSDEEVALWRAAMLDQARASATLRINARVGDLRRRIYSDIPGQDALYLEKRAEAVAYVAETNHGAEPQDLTDYPLLQNEVGLTAPTAWTLAQLWLNRSDQFKRIGAATDRLRMQAALALGTAPDEAAIVAIETALTEDLNALLSQPEGTTSMDQPSTLGPNPALIDPAAPEGSVTP